MHTPRIGSCIFSVVPRALFLLFVLSVLLFPLRGIAQLADPGDHGKADDAVRRAILAGSTVPTTILEVRQRLIGELKGTLRPHIVANGGHDNPARGNTARGVKFMVFETYEGPPDVKADELFIGYFLHPYTGQDACGHAGVCRAHRVGSHKAGLQLLGTHARRRLGLSRRLQRYPR